MEQVQHDLHQIRLRYGTNADKTAPTVPPENTKNIPNENEEDNESQQLTELLAPSNKALSAEGQKSHKGEIVVTSYGPVPKSSNEPVGHLGKNHSCSKNNQMWLASNTILFWRHMSRKRRLAA